MKLTAFLLMFAFIAGFSGVAYAEANGLAKGVEDVTHAPFAGLTTVNDHLFTPVKEVNGAAIGAADTARAWVVSVGLNMGQPVKE